MKISIRPQNDPLRTPLTVEEENDVMTWVELREAGAHTARITCRVCGLMGTVSVDNPVLLCGPCQCDLVMTRMHVNHCLASVESRWQAAIEAFDTTLEAADAETRQRWAAVEGARGTPLFAQAWAARRGEETAFGALLREYEAVERLTDELERWRAALIEIEIAEEGPAGALARHRAKREAMTTTEGWRPYGWWLGRRKDYRAGVSEADIRRDAAKRAKELEGL